MSFGLCLDGGFVGVDSESSSVLAKDGSGIDGGSIYIRVVGGSGGRTFNFTFANYRTRTKEVACNTSSTCNSTSGSTCLLTVTCNGFDFCVPANVSREFLARLLEATKIAC